MHEAFFRALGNPGNPRQDKRNLSGVGQMLQKKCAFGTVHDDTEQLGKRIPDMASQIIVIFQHCDSIKKTPDTI